jgi:hypothetical protein
MNPNPEQFLQQFRLPPPAPELRARALAAAREEWDRPSPASIWVSLRRPLLAVAASLVLLAAGHWTNQRLLSSIAVASAPPAATSLWVPVEMAGLPAPLFLHAAGGPADPRAARTALLSRQNQMRELMERIPSPPAAPAPNGQSHLPRQMFHPPASCC